MQEDVIEKLDQGLSVVEKKLGDILKTLPANKENESVFERLLEVALDLGQIRTNIQIREL